MFKGFFESRTTIIILSIIWGLGLSTLFKKSCDGRACKIIQYKGPNIDWVNKSIFSYDGNTSCYKYTPILNECQSNEESAKRVLREC